jgi:hypothetical protein
MLIPIFLFYLLRQFLQLRWSVRLILLFLFTPVFERLGFAQFLYVREMWKGFPEPIGYGAFLAALALTAQLRPDQNRAGIPIDTAYSLDRPGTCLERRPAAKLGNCLRAACDTACRLASHTWKLARSYFSRNWALADSSGNTS